MMHYEYLGKSKPVEGLFGLELETEGKRLPISEHLEGTSWEVVPDHSLRDGLEYVSKAPLTKIGAIRALTDLKYICESCRSTPSYSFRTSTHVHVNYTDASHNQILNAIITSMLLETVLVNYCSNIRIGNRFCLRLIDAEGIVDILKELFTSFNGRQFSRTRSMENNEAKYCATNIVPLFKLGTIEYRALQGTMDPKIIVPWLDALYNIKTYSLDSEDIMTIYQEASNNPSEWARKVLGDVADTFLYDGFEIDITTNLSLLIDVVYSTRKPFIMSPDVPESYYHIPFHVGGLSNTEVIVDEIFWGNDMKQHVHILEELPGIVGVYNPAELEFLDIAHEFLNDADFCEEEMRACFEDYLVSISEIKQTLIGNVKSGEVSLPSGFISSHKIERDSAVLNRDRRLGNILQILDDELEN